MVVPPTDYSEYPRSPRPRKVSFDRIGQGFDVVRSDPVTWIVGIFLGLILSAVPNSIVSLILQSVTGFTGDTAPGTSSEMFLTQFITYMVAAMFVSIVCYALTAPIMAGMYWMGVRAARGQRADISQIFSSFRSFKQLAIFALIYFLIVYAGMFLFVIPGIIAFCALTPGFLFVLDQRMDAGQAIRASWEATDGQRLAILGYFIAIGFLNILGMLLCGVGLLITIPMTYYAIGALYVDLNPNEPSRTGFRPDGPMPQ